MITQIEQIRSETLKSIDGAADIAAVEDIRVSVLGKKGNLTKILRSMNEIAPRDRAKVGSVVN